jgi:hypothetical protein
MKDYNPLDPENIYLEQLEKDRISKLTLVERTAELMYSYTGFFKSIYFIIF